MSSIRDPLLQGSQRQQEGSLTNRRRSWHAQRQLHVARRRASRAVANQINNASDITSSSGYNRGHNILASADTGCEAWLGGVESSRLHAAMPSIPAVRVEGEGELLQGMGPGVRAKQGDLLHSHEVSCDSSDGGLDSPPSPVALRLGVSPLQQPLPSSSSHLVASHSRSHHTSPQASPVTPQPNQPPPRTPASSLTYSRSSRTVWGIMSLLSPSQTSLSAAMVVVVLAATMVLVAPGMRQGGWAGMGPHNGAVGGAKRLLGWRAHREDHHGVHGMSGSGTGGPEVPKTVNILAVVPGGQPSPYKATWDEVMLHIAQRLEWNNPTFKMTVFTEAGLQQVGGEEHQQFMAAAKGAEILVGVQVKTASAVKAVQSAMISIPTHAFFESSPSLESNAMLDGYSPRLQLGPIRSLLEALPWTRAAQAKRVGEILLELYKRHSSDDLLFVFLVLINEYVTKVPDVANTAKGMDFDGLQCIGQHCSQQVFDCLGDPSCKTALDCLQACSFNDQVCQYRCIVSYESKPLEQFSLCILQLHNCRNLNAEIPMRPDPAPMSSFRGQPLTHEAAEGMFVGWMGEKPYSWLVAGGKNPAYDYFPCQHQLYYKGKGKGVLWYEPVFKALTLDGRQLWRRRRYRVRRGKVPGTFFYTVLDNGVTSNEFWRILDCANDFSFCLFYYSGAASAAGLSYSGAVLATPDGVWPEQHNARIQAALEPAGIKMWELSRVDNSHCTGAPLEKSPLAAPIAA